MLGLKGREQPDEMIATDDLREMSMVAVMHARLLKIAWWYNCMDSH